jgi:hypothetical protein
MELSKVRSKSIEAIGYDKDEELLEVVFKSGEVYVYKDVPHNIYMSFMTAPSLGTFFNEYVKNDFEFEKK